MSDLNENTKEKESIETSNNSQDSRLMDEFIGEFVESIHGKRDENEKEFNDFIDDVLDTNSSTTLNPIFATKLQTFRAKSNKYRHLDVTKLNKFDFQSEVFSRGNRIIAERDALFSRIDTEYNLSVEQKAALKQGIKKLKLTKISSILKTEKTRNAFMKEIFLENTPVKFSHKDFFKKLHIEFESLPENARQSLAFFRDEGIIHEDDFIEIVSHGFNAEQKRGLLAMFLPIISLQKLVDLKIIKQDEAYKQLLAKFDAEYPHIKEKFPDEKDRLTFFSQKFSLENVRVTLNHTNDPTKAGIMVNNASVDKILQDKELMSNITTEVEKTVKEVTKGEKIGTLAELKKILAEDVTGIQKKFPKIQDNVVPGKIFSIPYAQENEKKNAYVIVDKMDDGGIVFRTLNYADGYLDPNSLDGKSETKTLNEYVNFLNNIPPETQIIDKATLKSIAKEKDINEYAHETKIDTIDQLESLINAQDPKGIEHKLTAGTAFLYTVDGETLSARIKKVTSSGIEVEGAVNDHIMNFSFFYQAFLQGNAKRVGKVGNIPELMERLKLSGTKAVTEGFRNVVIEHGKLYPDDPNLKGTDKGEIKYLIGKGDMCAKIESFENGKIILIEGKLDEKEGKDGKKTSKMLKPVKRTLREDEFLMHAEKFEYKPKLDSDHVHQEKPKELDISRKNNFGTWLFSNHSLITVIAGGKQWFKAIEDGLKEGNDLLAAELALTLGKTLPDSLKHDLVNRVEGAQKKLMEEIVGRLNIDRVIDIIKTKNASEPQREAALMWTLGKFGQLYGEGLIDYRGTYMWYEFMGGKIGDAIFTKYMNDQKKDPEKPTQQVEEDLIIELLKAQGKNQAPPKRRLNFFKEAKAKVKSGKDEKEKDGLDDSKKFNTFTGKLELCKKFLTEGDYFALKGAFPDLVGKGDGNPKFISEIPFALVMSGAPKTWHQDLANAFKGIGSGCSIPILECIAAPNDVDMFGKAVVSLAYTISKEAGDQARAIEEMKQKGESEKKIVKACFEFWKEHGGKMIGKLQMTTDLTMLVSEDANVKQYLAKARAVSGKHEIKDEHRKNDVYNADHSYLMAIGGKDYVKKSIASLDQSCNTKTDLENKVTDSMVKQLEMIKTMEAPGPGKATPEQTKAFRIKAYKHLSKILMDTFIEKFANAQDIEKVNTTSWYQEIAKRIPLPATLDEKNSFIKNPGLVARKVDQKALEFLGYIQKLEVKNNVSEPSKQQEVVHNVIEGFFGGAKTVESTQTNTKNKVAKNISNLTGKINEDEEEAA